MTEPNEPNEPAGTIEAAAEDQTAATEPAVQTHEADAAEPSQASPPDDAVAESSEQEPPAETVVWADVTEVAEAAGADSEAPAQPDESEAAVESENAEPAVAESTEPQAEEPAAADTGTSESAEESVTLPDEAHSRTSELAARLRQSALAQVEAGRIKAAAASAPVVDESAEAEEPRTRTTDATGPIPSLDSAPERVSEPPAVPAAVETETAAPESSQTFLSGPAEPHEDSRTARLGLVTIVAGVLAVAAIVVLVVFQRSSSHDHAVDSARNGALAAAKTETATALSYSFTSLDADFAKAEQGMSTAFRAKYARTAATDVTPLAQKNQATSVGTVAAAGVISATTSKVSVLVFADQTNTNKLLGDKSRLDRSVIEVTMIKQSGHWVIDNLQPF